MNRALCIFLVCCLSAEGRVTYRVTENASACTEVRIPKWTRRAQGGDPLWQIDAWGCGYDVRTNGTSVYFGLSCGGAAYWRMTEKYAVDLNHPESIRQIDEATWEAGSVLDPSGPAPGIVKPRPEEVNHPVNLFAMSGPKRGEGGGLSPGGSRKGVNSWSGTDRDPPQLLFYEGSLRGFVVDMIRARYNGRYWIDIYDVASARRLVQIGGSSTATSRYIFRVVRSGLATAFTSFPLNRM